MTFDEIDQAYAHGRISGWYAEDLHRFLAAAEAGSTANSPVRALLKEVIVTPGGALENASPDFAAPPAYAIAPERRPGMLELFGRLHRGAVNDPKNPSDLAGVETFQQIQSLVRDQTQSTLARSIRDVMKAMGRWLERDAFVIPRDRAELRAPDSAETVEEEGLHLAILPWRSFAALYGVDRVEPLLALFRRCAERMGRHFTDAWLKRHASATDVQHAVALLRGLRRVSFGKTMGNGFASGVLDVVNPLHLLVVDVLRKCGPEVFTSEYQARIIHHHIHFSAFFATFSLACVAGLENLMGVPASRETLATVRLWTSAVRDIRGKGFPLDCDFAPEYFRIHAFEDEGVPATPLIDFNVQAFSETELNQIASQTVRLGCPSLGTPHRHFTQAICRAYFQAVFPVLAETYRK